MASIQKRLTRRGKEIAAERGEDKVPAKEIRWTARVFLGRDPNTGKRRFGVKTFGKKGEAEAWADKLSTDLRSGIVAEPSKEPLSRYLDSWLSAHAGEVRARTIHDYRGILRRYVQEPEDASPPIGAIRLDRLRPEAFDALYTYLWEERGLAPRTIRYLHTILRKALGDAVGRGALARNPTDHAKVPRRARDKGAPDAGKKKFRAMSEAEAGKFLEKAGDDRFFALWAVLLMGGLRPGEALGLKWEDVNLEAGKLHVRRSLNREGVPKPCECGHNRSEHKDRGRGACGDPSCKCASFTGAEGAQSWRLQEPKTKKARRVVVIPPVAVRALQEWKRTQAAERLQLGSEYQAHGFVFTSEFGAPLDNANLSRRNYRRILQAAGLGTPEVFQGGRWIPAEEVDPEKPHGRKRFRPAFRLYDLRHTCATLLLKKGVHAKIVQERLGHASITLTLDTYSHVLPDMQEGAAEEFEAMFGTGA